MQIINVKYTWNKLSEQPLCLENIVTKLAMLANQFNNFCNTSLNIDKCEKWDHKCDTCITQKTWHGNVRKIYRITVLRTVFLSLFIKVFLGKSYMIKIHAAGKKSSYIEKSRKLRFSGFITKLLLGTNKTGQFVNCFRLNSKVSLIKIGKY